MYVIADPYATTIDEDERKAYAYDEDANGWWFGQDSDSPRDTRDRFFTAPLSGTGGLDYELNPFTEAVIKTAILAIDGKTNEIDARNELRIFAAHYIFGAWGFGGGPSNVLYPTPIDITIASSLTSGLTDDMIASKNIPDPLQPRGQCLDFNAVNIAISRAVGFAARFASGQTWIPNVFVDPKYQPSGTKWRYHAWTEGRVENPPTGTDNWYIFDATDNVETQNEGISKSRIDYGTLWDPQRAWIGDKTTIMNAEEVTSSYY